MVAAVLAFSSSSTIIKWAEVPGLGRWRSGGCCSPSCCGRSSSPCAGSAPGSRRPAWRRSGGCCPAGLAFGLNITLFFTAIGKTSIAHAEFIAASARPARADRRRAVPRAPRPRALPWGARLARSAWRSCCSSAARRAGPASAATSSCCASSATWIVYLVTARRARATVDVVDFMATMMPIGVLTAAPIALHRRRRRDLADDAPSGWIAACMLAVLTGMIGHGLIAFAQRELPVAHDRHHPGRPAGARGVLELPRPRRARSSSPQIPGHGPRDRRPRRRSPSSGSVDRRRAAATVDADQHGELAGPAG